MRGDRQRGHTPHREGYVLIAVLIVIVVLALLAYRFADAMTAEYRAGTRTADMAKVRAAALSGIHFTAAAMADPNTFVNQLGSNPFNNSNAFQNVLVWTDPKNPKKEVRFSIVSVVPVSQGVYQQQYGVIDEGGKINVNAWIALDPSGNALYNVLYNPTNPLPNMTPTIASNIVAWVAPPNTPSPNGAPTGAQSSYYETLPKPYQAKNGPLNSLDELLLVQGVTPQLLYGTDQNQNGLPDDANGQAIDRGWSDYLTVNGRELNVDSTGTLRINLNGDDLNGIYNALQNASIDGEMAAYIMAAKLYGTTPYPTPTVTVTVVSPGGKGNTGGKGTTGGGSSGGGSTTITLGGQSNKVGTSDDLIKAVQTSLSTASSSGKAIGSILDLQNTQVTLPTPAGAPKNAAKTIIVSPLYDQNKMMTLLPSLMDKLTTTQTVEMTPRLNVNTATQQVLLGLPGLTSSDVDSIIGAQPGLVPGDPATTSGAWLVTAANLPLAKYKALSKFVTGSSLIYRVQAIGYYTGGGPTARIEALIDTNLGAPRILYVRDLASLDNPRGFPPPEQQK